MEQGKRGVLYLVATPIGNLSDMTFRAVDTLRAVDFVLAEDTRSFRRLAQHYGIETPAESYHDHNERSKAANVIERLQDGASAALVSDAGTPLISDPGYLVVNAAHDAGVQVISIPGACSAVTALALTGFDPHRFAFEGFLPPKSGRRRSMLTAALDSNVTTIFFESPHRLLKSLAELEDLAPEREVAVCRELTKIHEECVRGTAREVHADFASRNAVLGEIVLVIRPTDKSARSKTDYFSVTDPAETDSPETEDE